VRGYFTFLIVFAAFALLLSLAQLNLNSKSHNLSGAIITEKFYRVQMNVKEVIIESARQGAQKGFDDYASTHTLAACSNPETQAQCFRENEARAAANAGALANMELLVADSNFDNEMIVVLLPGTYPVETSLKLSAAHHSGYELDTVTISKSSDMMFTLGSKKDSSLSTEVVVPKITVDMDESAGYS